MRRLLRVDRPVVDVYRKPDSHSERINQLLFNEPVIRTSTRGDFARVRSTDDYTGWIRKDHAEDTILKRPDFIVDVPAATLIDDRTERFAGKLSFGTRISIVEIDDQFGKVEFRQRAAWISMGCVRKLTSRKLRWPKIRAYLENLIGTPYLWGGRSGFGLDCSGLVQLVYTSCGYSLSRDSIDQREQGAEISVEYLRPGYLIFSPGHVCIYFGSGQIVHSSVRAGGVYVENLLPDMPCSRADIYAGIEKVRRVLRTKTASGY